MDDTTQRVAAILGEAARTHHQVYRIVDGQDPDRASYYAAWLLRLSRLPQELGTAPVRGELVYLLVLLDKQYTAAHPDQSWESVYATGLVTHFANPGVTPGGGAGTAPA